DIAVTFNIFNAHGELVAGTDTQMLDQPIVDFEGVGAVCFDFADMPLLDGRYSVDVSLTSRSGGIMHDSREDAVIFEIMQPGAQRGRVSLEPTVVHFFHNHAPEEPVEDQAEIPADQA